MFSFVGLDVVNHSIMSDQVLQPSQRGSFLSSFCLGRSSGCKDLFSKIPLLYEVFDIHAEGSTLGSPVPLTAMKREVILLFRMGKIMLLWLQMFHLRLTLDGFEDVLIGSFSGVKLLSTQ